MKHKIIVTARINRKRQAITPEMLMEEIDINRTFPMFLGNDDKYYAVPGQETADVLNEWLAQFGWV